MENVRGGTPDVFAKEFGWDPVESRDPYMVSFVKMIDGTRARINIWDGKRGITVGTYIYHPTQKRTQLFRRWVSTRELRQIFQNPRVHTGKGYRYR